MADNPLIGRIDSETIARTREILTQALRPVRIRLVNRIGADVPLTIKRCELIQLDALRGRLVQEEIRLLARIRMQHSGASVLLGLDAGLLFRMIGLLLGEGAPSTPVPVAHRPFTRADLRIARRLVDDLVAGLQDGLPYAASHELLSVEDMTDDPNINLDLPPNAAMIDTTVEVGEPGNPLGTAVLSIPANAARILVPSTTAAAKPKSTQRGIARVLPITVDAVAELARVKTRLSAIQDLDVGDLLPLGRPQSIEVRVRDRVALIAEPGVSDTGGRCIRILRNVHDLERIA